MGRAREIADLIGGTTPDIILKTSDGAILNLQTSDTTVTADSVLGAINFQAPDEASGTDAILIGSKIEAIAEGTFSASSNATSLVFSTASSAAAGTVSGKMTFTSGGNLIIKDTDTADGSSPTITLQSGDTDIAADDILGSINFQAPDEGTGTDAILVAAGIQAVSEGDFSSSSNATSLVFKTGASEAAAEKVRITSGGHLGIGEDSPNSDLVVKQSGSTFTTASQTVALFQRNTATGSGCKVTILSGNNTSGDLNFGDAEDEDIGKISYEHNNNAMTFTTNTAETMRIDSTGAITKPLQPAFHVINGTDLANITTNNTENTVKFDTESFDINADFNTTSFTFTAPVTGKYQFNVSLSVSQIDTAATQYLIRLNTSNRNYHLAIDPEFSEDVLFPFSISALADMDASDTAIVTIAQNGGTAQTDVRADPGSHFSGFLAC
jgi:hypothetical protein